LSNIVIIGLGYVGLPLAKLFLQKQHVVYGVDYDIKKIESIKNGKSYLSDFIDEEIQAMYHTENFHVGNSYQVIESADVIILCVPTPLTENDTPDISFIENAITSSLPFLKSGQLIVLESSTYPGTTEEIIVPLICKEGFMIGKDFYVAYSPERIDPGQKKFSLAEIPKVVGGYTLNCTNKAKEIYETIFHNIVPVSSPKVAEMSKLVENSQRLINISFMNELAMYCDNIEVDIWEVIQASSTKPFGFTPYYPGPGIGGHCIPVDPLYLLWKAKKHDLMIRSVEIAHEINEKMPEFVINKIARQIIKPLSVTKILVIGVTYKKDVNDIRESRAIDVIKGLIEKGAMVEYHDPYIPQMNIYDRELSSTLLSPEKLKEYDCTVILTEHSNLPYKMIVEESKLVVDTRNATGEYKHVGNIVFL
jgi:UDP-N-acetyl-D-glucosamine dehydrogenase